jgi:hypothetical protein
MSQTLTDSTGDADTGILDSSESMALDTFKCSNFGIQNDIAPSQHPHDSMKIPTELAKRASQKSDSFRKHIHTELLPSTRIRSIVARACQSIDA